MRKVARDRNRPEDSVRLEHTENPVDDPNVKTETRGPIKLPVSVDKEAPFKVIDAEGSPVAICGIKGNVDRYGAEFAKQIADALNARS